MEVFKEAGKNRKSLADPNAVMVLPDVLCRLFEEYTAPPSEDACVEFVFFFYFQFSIVLRDRKEKKFRLKDNIHLNMANLILESLFEKRLPHETEDYIFESGCHKIPVRSVFNTRAL
jgi:hypothetical protein